VQDRQSQECALAAAGATDAPKKRAVLPLWLQKALDAMTIAVVMIGILELSARVVLSRPELLARVDRTSDAPWRLDWLRRHADGVEVYYSFDVYHPTRGWALRPNLRDADPYGPDSLNSNSVGMRGSREFTLDPPADRTRIVLIGDSFTFGEEVADWETFAFRLQELLPQTEVLNLGVHGYGHDQMLIGLRELGLRYRPDVVLLGFVEDDMERNMLGFRDYAKPRYRLRDGALALRGSPVPPPAEVVQKERYRSRFLDLVDMVHQTVLWRVGVNQRRMEALTAALLDEVAAEAASVGAATGLFYLPHSVELMEPASSSSGQAFFNEYCHDRDALCLDLRPSFLSRIEAGYPIKVPGHWHGNGHTLVAEELAGFLTERGLAAR
jgi:hypothetical protein